MRGLNDKELYEAYVAACLEAGAEPATFSEYTGVQPHKEPRVKFKMPSKPSWLKGELFVWIGLGIALLGAIAVSPYIYWTASYTTSLSNALWLMLGDFVLIGIICGVIVFFACLFDDSGVVDPEAVFGGMLFGAVLGFFFLFIPFGIATNYKIENKQYLDPIVETMANYNCILEDKSTDEIVRNSSAYISFWDQPGGQGKLYETYVYKRGKIPNMILLLQETETEELDVFYTPGEFFAIHCGVRN